MNEFIIACLFVVLAEMGDKTQLLAMAFATKYKWQTVLWAVLVATLLNHLLAVLAGAYLTELIPVSYIKLAAAFAFILFGLWTIKGDKLDNNETRSRYGPFLTVAIAFFLAEMGDKTQLATIALAAKYNSVLFVWMGTTTGMMIADAFGIVIGCVLGKRIPERAVKWFAAIIFILFGLYGLFECLPPVTSRIYIMAFAIFATVGATIKLARAAALPNNTDKKSKPGKQR